MQWSDNTSYWLSHNQWTGFQNGSAAWFLGGTNVTVNGHGYGTLDGNGQAWQDSHSIVAFIYQPGLLI